MTHIAFFEPSYAAHNRRDWEIRGSYKYPSLLGDLHKCATVTVSMRTLPPEGDPHRRRLETDHGVRFLAIDTLEDAGEHAVEMLADDYSAVIATEAPDIVSTLNGRPIGHNYALARAAHDNGVDYVYRIAGNDIATQTAVRESDGYPFTGTGLLANLLAQERYAAEVARTVIVMGGTERARAEGLVSDPGKIRICRRGVDRAHFAPPPDAPARCDRILFVGRDSAEKGIDLIEGAAAILAEQRPAINFVIAGDFAAREESNRRYLGFHDYAALPGLYRDNHALLLPARSEGFPQVVMEAMSCGLPAILSKSLFADDFGAEDGVALVERNAQAIADAIMRWHDDPALFAAERTRARDHAAAHFDAAVNGALYHRALLDEPT
ncbi:glycosyltransferase [Parasphingopyxis algicola]|uniref:glycosyltransferase n=1 Tax=Parasphingopyxis algicola TaxID=2026624 RepID=UPI0015A063D7|nr:glycosyltransferase [Parasphingopyxis algicola]QLC23986.1 glycosyltransferase [Parasphingopyxis algicola]